MCFHPQQLDSIHVTVLHKEEGTGLGFSLAGGADLENKVITVSGPGVGTPVSEWGDGGVKGTLEVMLCWEDTRPPGRGQDRSFQGKPLGPLFLRGATWSPI